MALNRFKVSTQLNGFRIPIFFLWHVLTSFTILSSPRLKETRLKIATLEFHSSDSRDIFHSCDYRSWVYFGSLQEEVLLWLSRVTRRGLSAYQEQIFPKIVSSWVPISRELTSSPKHQDIFSLLCWDQRRPWLREEEQLLPSPYQSACRVLYKPLSG